MIKCPQCSEPTFSFWKKFCIGPLRTVKCKACKRKVGVSVEAWLAVSFQIAGLVLALYVVDSIPVKILAFSTGVGLCIYLYAVKVTLVARSE